MGMELARAFISVRADAQQLPGDLKQVQKMTDASLSGMESMIANKLNGLAMMGKTLIAGFLADLAIGSTVQLAAQLEDTTVAFKVMLGSASAARDVIKDLTLFAARTPFEMSDIMPAARGLIQFGERGEEMLATLKILGNAASGTGSRFSELALIFNQVRGAGRLMTQDFYQLSTRGVISLQDLAKHFKVTTAEAKELMSKGKIGFGDLKATLEDLSGPGGKFFNMMEEKSKTFNGLMSTLKDEIKAIGTELGMVVLPYLKDMTLEVGAQISEIRKAAAAWGEAWDAAHGKGMGASKIKLSDMMEVPGKVLTGQLAVDPLIKYWAAKGDAEAARKENFARLEKESKDEAAREKESREGWQREWEATEKAKADKLKSMQDQERERALGMVRSVRSPAKIYEEEVKQIQKLVALFPSLFRGGEAFKLMGKAAEDFDKAMKGPEKRKEEKERMDAIKDRFKSMADSVRDMKIELAGGSVELAKFAEMSGVTTEMTAKFSGMTKELEKLKKFKELKDFAVGLTESVKTPIEQAKEDLLKMKEAFSKGLITPDVYARGLKGLKERTETKPEPAFTSVGVGGLGKQLQDAILQTNSPAEKSAKELLEHTKLLGAIRDELIKLPKDVVARLGK